MSSRVHGWWASAWGDRRAAAIDASGAQHQPDIGAIRQAMEAAVSPCTARHRSRAAVEIARASTVIELWLLRSTLYQYLAQDLGESAAKQRVGELLPLFKDAVPTGPAGGPFGARSGHEPQLH